MHHRPKVILLVPSAREYDRGVLRGIVEYARIHGPWTFYEEPPAYLAPLNQERRLAHMVGWDADGLIALQERQEEISALHLPTVVMMSTCRPPEEQCQIVTDNVGVSNLAADYLRSLGLANFAYCGLAGMEWASERSVHFCRNLKGTGFEVHVYEPRNVRSGESWYTEENRLGDWLAELPKPIGLMACNDDRARMITEICRTRQILVPDDIAILGVDNDDHVCGHATPPLSSVALATERGGYEAAVLLDRLMTGQPIAERRVVVAPLRIAIRQSTDLIAISDPNVVKAVRFIRENRKRPIQVRDVAAAAGLSRRILQDRFRRATGQTVLDSIHRTRVQTICELLAETHLSVSEIAATVGYQEDVHIARFFSRQIGMTPIEYRRRYGRP